MILRWSKLMSQNAVLLGCEIDYVKLRIKSILSYQLKTFSRLKQWIAKSWYIIYFDWTVFFSFSTIYPPYLILNPAGNYMLKVNNRDTRKICEICSKLTIKTPERCHCRCSGVFIVNFQHISHLVLVFLLLTLRR